MLEQTLQPDAEGPSNLGRGAPPGGGPRHADAGPRRRPLQRTAPECLRSLAESHGLVNQVGGVGELIPADGFLENGCGSKIEDVTVVSPALTGHHDDGNPGHGRTAPARCQEVESAAARTEKVLNDQVNLVLTKNANSGIGIVDADDPTLTVDTADPTEPIASRRIVLDDEHSPTRRMVYCDRRLEGLVTNGAKSSATDTSNATASLPTLMRPTFRSPRSMPPT